jgi:HSP20 family protein
MDDHFGPLAELRMMQEQMNRLFDLSRARLCGETSDQGSWQPPVDILENSEAVVIAMELPEVRQQDIEIHLEQGVLTIQGERRQERPAGQHSYHRIERNHGPFRRSFVVPVPVAEGQISMTCAEGVLKIILPKHLTPSPGD